MFRSIQFLVRTLLKCLLGLGLGRVRDMFQQAKENRTMFNLH